MFNGGLPQFEKTVKHLIIRYNLDCSLLMQYYRSLPGFWQRTMCTNLLGDYTVPSLEIKLFYCTVGTVSSVVQCSAVQCSAVQCSAAQRSAVQCSAVVYTD